MPPLHETGIDGIAVQAEAQGYRVVATEGEVVVPISDWFVLLQELRNYMIPMMAGLLIGVGIAEFVMHRNSHCLWCQIAAFNVDSFLHAIRAGVTSKALSKLC